MLSWLSNHFLPTWLKTPLIKIHFFDCYKIITQLDLDFTGEASSSTGSHSKSRNPAKQMATKVAKRLEDKQKSSDPSSEGMIDFLDGDDVPLVEEVAEKQFWNR